MLETDLYEPVRKLFEQNGYAVNAEILDCDMVAKHEDETIVIELKTSFNLKLVHQIIKRQAYADIVYAAIPRPKTDYRSRRWEEITRLFRRLEAGLIVVSEVEGCCFAEVAIHPKPYVKRKNNRIITKISQEAAGRTLECNKGGASRIKLMTAYRENALFIACCLHVKGAMQAKELKQLGTGNKTGSILSKNFYGWFEKTEEGQYTLTAAGKAALKQYEALSEHYYNKIYELQDK